jgi:toxin YoeB
LGNRKKATSKTKPARETVFHAEFIKDLHYWVEQDRRIALKALELIEAITRDPFSGIGKPEPLKHMLAGAWSRRLTQEHRIIYTISHNQIHFLEARYHY